MDLVRTGTVTILDTESVSSAVTMNPTWKLIGLVGASTWDTQAATFQISVDGSTYVNVYNEGTEYSVASFAHSTFQRVDLNMFTGARSIKVRSGTAGTPAAQSGDCTLTLVFWKVDSMDLVRSGTVTVANGQSLSGAVTMNPDWKLIGVITDAEWDTAAMTFQITTDGTNYYNVYNEGTEYSLAGVVASAFNRVDAAMFYGARAIKVRSGTAASATNQSGATTATLVFWKID